MSCNKGFGLRTDLAKHIEARHRVGNKSFLCQVPGCRFISIRKDNLQQHMRQRHSSWENGGIRGESTGNATGATRQLELCQAAGLGNLSVVQRLIDIGEDVSVKAKDGSTPLHCASRAGHVDVLILLLESGCALSEKNDMGRTALQEAASGNHIEAVRTLVDLGADAQSILHTVTKTGTQDLIEFMIKWLGFEYLRLTSIMVRRKGYLSPLHLAALHGNEPVLRALLSDPEIDLSQKSTAQWTPLHYAALSGHDDIINILLETKQVDVNLAGRKGRKPLHCAAIKGHERVVKRLLACEDLDVNARDFDTQRVPAQLAAASGNLPVLELLLRDDRLNRSCMKPLSLHNGNVQSLLQVAVRSEQFETIEWLLSTQDIYRSPNTVNEHLLLHHAAYRGIVDMVKLLLERKDVDIESRAGQMRFHPAWQNKTAIQVARRNGENDIVKILLGHGAIEYPTEVLALPAALESNKTSAVLSSEVSEMENESSQDLDMDEDMVLDFEM
jgi:ankyrin repeat protein